MRTVVYLLDMPNADGNAGVSKRIDTLRDATVYIHGTGTVSLKVQVKVSAQAAPTVVPPGNPNAVAPPTTAKPSNDDPPETAVDDDWFDLKTVSTLPALVPIADQTTGARLTVTHVRIFRTTITGGGPPTAEISGRDSRTH